MLQLSGTLLGRPVVSLRTGQPVAVTTGFLINPNNLKIEGLYCNDKFEKSELILLYQDIRDVLPQGIIINDHDVLAHSGDLVKFKKLIDLDFQLIDKKVVSINKHRIGKVNDFAVEIETMFIQKLYVAQGFIKSFTGGSLSVDRSQIHEITKTKIVILDPLESGTVQAGAPA